MLFACFEFEKFYSEDSSESACTESEIRSETSSALFLLLRGARALSAFRPTGSSWLLRETSAEERVEAGSKSHQLLQGGASRTFSPGWQGSPL